MSDRTYEHELTGKRMRLSDPVAKLFPAFKPVELDAEDQTALATPAAPTLVVAPAVVKDIAAVSTSRNHKREVAN